MPTDLAIKLLRHAAFADVHPSAPLDRWPVDQRGLGLDGRTLLPQEDVTGLLIVPGLVLAFPGGDKYQVTGGIAAWTLANQLARDWGSARVRIPTLVQGFAPTEFGELWLQRELMLAGVYGDTSVLRALLAQEDPLVCEMSHKAVAKIFGITAGTSSLLRRQANPQRFKKPPAIKAKVAPAPEAAPSLEVLPTVDAGRKSGLASPPPPQQTDPTCPTYQQYSLL